MLVDGRTATSDRARRAHGYESPREDVQQHVPLHASRILDLGCSTGALGAALKRRQDAVVVGVEIDPDYAAQARARLDRVIVSDIESFLADSIPAEAPFDCLIAADVLEHLVDPWTTLRRAAELLDRQATAVISVPNVLEWRGLWRLIRTGRWPLADAGVFDRTHLRWFTRDDALALVRQAGLRPLDVDARYWETDPKRLQLKRCLAKTPLDRFLPFQYIISAAKSGASRERDAGVLSDPQL
jgi:2-polyprenyl-3-methyl-5-hydroxy-6-metoxy-1,4-benzoquinol methylase